MMLTQKKLFQVTTQVRLSHNPNIYNQLGRLLCKRNDVETKKLVPRPLPAANTNLSRFVLSHLASINQWPPVNSMSHIFLKLDSCSQELLHTNNKANKSTMAPNHPGCRGWLSQSSSRHWRKAKTPWQRIKESVLKITSCYIDCQLCFFWPHFSHKIFRWNLFLTNVLENLLYPSFLVIQSS